MTGHAGKKVGKGKLLFIAGWNANWYHHYGNQCQFLGKLGLDLPQDPAILLLDTYPEDSVSCYRDLCTSVSIAALFIITRHGQQPRCSSADGWVNESVEYYSAVKKMKLVFKWLELGGKKITLGEVIQPQQNKCLFSIIGRC